MLLKVLMLGGAVHVTVLVEVLMLVLVHVSLLIHVTLLMHVTLILHVTLLTLTLTLRPDHMMIMDSIGMMNAVGMVGMGLAQLKGEILGNGQMLVFQMRQKIVHVRNGVKVTVRVLQQVFRNAFVQTRVDVHQGGGVVAIQVGMRGLCLCRLGLRLCLNRLLSWLLNWLLLLSWLLNRLLNRLHRLPLPVDSQHTLNVRLKLLLVGQSQDLTAVVTRTVLFVLRTVQTLGTVGVFVFHPRRSLSFSDGWRGSCGGGVAGPFLCLLLLVITGVAVAGLGTVTEIAAIVRQVLFHFVRHVCHVGGGD